MANDKSRRTEAEIEKYRRDVARQLNVVNYKLNLLLENAGLGEKLRVLAEELRGPTEQLEASVKANQP